MKMFRKTIMMILVLLLFSAVTVSAQSVGAVYSNNSAQIDWGSLSISGGSLSTYGSYYSWSRSYATDAWWLPPTMTSYVSDYQAATAVTNASSTSGTPASFNYALSSGATMSLTITASAEAEVSVAGDAFSAEGLAQRGQTYLVGTGGTINFSIDYSFLSQALEATEGYAYGYVRAWAQLRLYNWDTGTYDLIGPPVIEVSQYNITADDFTLAAPFNDDLSLSYDAKAGDYLLFETGVDARSAVQKAVVPIPGAVWLLGSGLLGLVGIRRFRN